MEANLSQVSAAMNLANALTADDTRDIHWLSNSSQLIQSPMHDLVTILKTEIDTHDWMLIGTIVPTIKNKPKVECKLRILAREGIITGDLIHLIALMQAINRIDLAISIQQLQSFQGLTDQLFNSSFRREVATLARDLDTWTYGLQEYAMTQNKMVRQVLEDNVPVPLESVYVAVTIIKHPPSAIRLVGETSYNEMEFLRQIANEEVNVFPIDFSRELEQYDASTAEIWCLLGNAGSGKTFLCRQIALRFSRGELSQFSYTISIPCRTPDWHYMDSTRIHADLPIGTDFTQKWLSLGMPVGASWTPDLAEHLLETEGRGLLLIIDSFDEYIREFPFEKTFLCFLLKRRTLTRCTILLTSRPGAYTDISTSHALCVNRFYQVLGFSPANRDLYFRIRLSEKIEEWNRLLCLHDEMGLLSMVPVNASLFATLVRDSDEVTAQSLTQIYSQLTTYLIRRQLSRMGLQVYEKRSSTLSQLHPHVGECLRHIGQIAFQGVISREFTFSKEVNLRVGGREEACQWLGLVVEDIQKNKSGEVAKVWSFPHLTMQEFLGSFWLCTSSWWNQCASIRYILQAYGNLYVFKMLLRFLSGLLTDKAHTILSILYKHIPNTPLRMENLPSVYQLCYTYTPMHSITGWTEFTEKYVVLLTLMFECRSQLIYNSFSYFKQFLTSPFFFYFKSAITPNEWECFVQSVRFLQSIQLILIDTHYVTVPQFKLLFTTLNSCFLNCLAVTLHKKDFASISPYCDVIKESRMSSQTQVALDLSSCKLDDIEPFSTGVYSCIFSTLRLYYNELSRQCLQQLSCQLPSTDHFYLEPRFFSGSTCEYDFTLPQLSKSTQLTGLHLRAIPCYHLTGNATLRDNLQAYQYPGATDQYKEMVETETFNVSLLQFHISSLSNLQELTVTTGDASADLYSLLPQMTTFTKLSYLHLQPSSYFSRNRNYPLLELLIANIYTLKGLRIHFLDRVISRYEFLGTLQYCSNLVEIQLWNALTGVKDSLWYKAMSSLRYLLYFRLYYVTINNSEMLSVCKGLVAHPAIRQLDIRYSSLNSASCEPLAYLLPTLSHLSQLRLNGLSRPDPKPIQLLRQTADLCSVSHSLS